ncbi:MAG: XdhC family protein [bacterium]|nr:XdhC family protein [bacterium]
MSAALEFWRTVERHLGAGEKVFLALVAENTRHSPGTAGARLLLTEGGERHGTVGGGVMELKLLGRAAGILRGGDFVPEIRTLHHRREGEGERSGMICAGSQTNLEAVCRPDADLDTVRRIVGLLEDGHPGTISIDPSGMTVEERTADLSLPQVTIERDERSWRYREELLNRKRLAILGGGHCALALTRAMCRLGYDVFVFETRENVFEDELSRLARSVEIVEDFALAGAMIDYPEITWVVVMTTDFPSDVRALTGALDRPFRFLGLMGAAAKLEEIKERLAELGFTPEQHERITAPVGLPIPSHTPEEIAVSVAAQILQLRGEES